MATAPNTYLTPEQYLEIERRAQEKSEYWNGEMFAMSGGTWEHSTLAATILLLLSARLRDRGCHVHGSDLRVRVGGAGLYTYPDVSVVCGKPEFADSHRDTLLNPSAIIEVLSPSTEGYDRGRKFEQYRTIPSLREYVLIAQDRVYAEVHTRANAGWQLVEFRSGEQELLLPTLGVSIPLREIYREIEFPD